MALQPLPRQQRRKVRRDAIERGRKLLARGLGPELAEDEAVGLALILHERLTDLARPRRAAEAAEIAESLLEKSLAVDIKSHDLGCRKGCSYCCSALVTCTAPEIFRIAHWLVGNGGGGIDMAAVAAEASRRGALAPTELFLSRTPCPFLIKNACGIYAVRPIPCRALLSLSSEACRLAMEDNQGEVPVVAPAMNKGEMVRTVLLAAVTAAGLPDRGIELNAGIAAVIGKPDAEAQWLAGENVFEGVLGGERMASARGAQEHIAKMLALLAD